MNESSQRYFVDVLGVEPRHLVPFDSLPEAKAYARQLNLTLSIREQKRRKPRPFKVVVALDLQFDPLAGG